MELPEAIQLIRNDKLTQQSSTVWTDLGCGSGLFTLALAELLKPGSKIYAVDKEPVTLKLPDSLKAIEIKTLQADFVADSLPFCNLDGILMVQSLHYVPDKKTLIEKLSEYLMPGGCFLIVEYDTDTPAPPWVPFPVSFAALKRLFVNAGFTTIQKINERPSIYGRAKMYAALISP